MEVYYRIQVNVLAFMLLLLLFFIAHKKLDKSNRLNRAFLLTMTGVIFGLFFETISVLFNAKATHFAIFVNNLSSVAIFALAPMISFYFFIFIFNLIKPDKKFNAYIWVIIVLPIIVNIMLSILSPFFGFFFSIGVDGVYARGPLFPLSAFSTYIFMALGVAIVVLNFKRMLKLDFWMILGIGIIPILGGVAQGLVYGILAMWSSAAVALLIGYLFLQDRMIRLDSLTGTWSRESFYITYTRQIQLNPDRNFGAIYFDIDNLKQINDTYGHLEGDKAIKLVMEIMRKVLPPGAVISRLGGDEFIIVKDCETQKDIDILLTNIKSEFQDNAKIKVSKYPLECSFGASVFTSEFSSLNAFLSKLDQLMYQEKFSKRKI